MRIIDIDTYKTNTHNLLFVAFDEFRHISPTLSAEIARNMYLVFNEEKKDEKNYLIDFYHIEISLFDEDSNENRNPRTNFSNFRYPS